MTKPRNNRPRRHNLVSIAEAADYAGCSVKTIRRRISDGSLIGYRMGPRLIRVDLNELETLLRPIPSARLDAPPGSAWHPQDKRRNMTADEGTSLPRGES